MTSLSTRAVHDREGRPWWRRILACAGVGMAALTLAAPTHGAESAQTGIGWQGMRIIHHPGWSDDVRLLDVNGDGRDEVVLVNRRQTRLDIYSWLPAAERKDPLLDADAPNMLPMAREFSHTELPLEDLPEDVLLLKHKDQLLLAVLTMRPNRLQLFAQKDGSWTKVGQRNVLPGVYAGLPVLHDEAGKRLYIACEGGVQELDLSKESRAEWLRPKEVPNRWDWWLADLDGQGRSLVEAVRMGSVSLRRSSLRPQWRPAIPIHQRSVRDAVVLQQADGPDRIVVLDDVQDQLLRAYGLADEEVSAFGQRADVSLPPGKVSWTVMDIAGDPAVVASDSKQPRLLLSVFKDGGWQEAQMFPGLGKIKALAPGPAGTVLIWVDGASALTSSSWEGGRLSFPRPMPGDDADPADSLLHLGHDAGVTWWVIKRHKDLVLYRQAADGSQSKSVFTGAAGKAAKLLWLGGERLLVQDSFARKARLLQLVDGKVTSAEPAHLKKVVMSEYKLIPTGAGSRLARMVDGVLQWLDDDLQPVDQVMLDEAQGLVSYVVDDNKQIWGLQSGGKLVHRLQADKAGVLRVVDSIELDGGSALHYFAGLGFVMQAGERLSRFAPGKAQRLRQLASLDIGDALQEQIHEAAADRLFAVDLNGDGQDELLVTDDGRHRISVLQMQDKQLKVLSSWQIFEDKTYPYGRPKDREADTEPRSIKAGDVDGDGQRELVLLCHDRILIYLGKDGAAASAKKEGTP